VFWSLGGTAVGYADLEVFYSITRHRKLAYDVYAKINSNCFLTYMELLLVQKSSV